MRSLRAEGTRRTWWPLTSTDFSWVRIACEPNRRSHLAIAPLGQKTWATRCRLAHRELPRQTAVAYPEQSGWTHRHVPEGLLTPHNTKEREEPPALFLFAWIGAALTRPFSAALPLPSAPAAPPQSSFGLRSTSRACQDGLSQSCPTEIWPTGHAVLRQFCVARQETTDAASACGDCQSHRSVPLLTLEPE